MSTPDRKRKLYAADLTVVEGVYLGGFYIPLPPLRVTSQDPSDICIVTSVTVGVNGSFVSYMTDFNSTAKEMDLEEFKNDYIQLELSYVY